MKIEILIIVALLVVPQIVRAAHAPAAKIVLIAGKKSHGPEGNGMHDYNWSARLLKTALEELGPVSFVPLLGGIG